MREKRNSLLLSTVPLSRGMPVHIEHRDDTAVTVSHKDKVLEMHTPQDALRRIHESLHARHTYDRHRVDGPDMVAQLVEDVRLHTGHWPWPANRTPLPIASEVRSYLLGSLDAHAKAIEAGESATTDFPVFFESLRASAVCFGITGKFDLGLGLLQPYLRGFAQKCLALIMAGQTDRQQAADEITSVFFAEEENERPGRPKKSKGNRPVKPVMKIVDLPKTERCSAQESGVRLATSGARIYRPALRRPVLPARLFVRNAPIEPAGTILIDASGSMGSFDFIVEQMQREPGATIAYYNAGSTREGKLFIYAKDGWRANGELPSAGGGNVVDGPALNWLLKQDGPRIFITDRCFSGAYDSEAQIVRLANAEAQGLLTVHDYEDKK